MDFGSQRLPELLAKNWYGEASNEIILKKLTGLGFRV